MAKRTIGGPPGEKAARVRPDATTRADVRQADHLAAMAAARSGLAPIDDASLSRAGLDAAQVAERREAGLDNSSPDHSSRTIGQILRANVFTLFNVVLGICLVVVLAVGKWPDALFGVIVFANIAIGVVQEYRAKRTLDRLAVLNAPHARVLRGGSVVDIEVDAVVYDDVLVLRTGDQVPADAVVLSSAGLEIDESLLTGESDPIDKVPGDHALSGSAVVAGSGTARVDRVGAESFASRITAEAKRFSLVNSEIRAAINRIVLCVTWALVPIILLVVNSQMQAGGGWHHAFTNDLWREALVAAVAAIVAMIPEGLVLLTSISFALAAVTLARRQVLIQELPAVEGLARVDVVCLDKTGTLTEGALAFADEIPLADVAGSHRVLGWLGADENANATAASLASTFPQPPRAEAADTVPFTSGRKWSAVSFRDPVARGARDPHEPVAGWWVFGAPEIVLHGSTAHAADLARAAELSDRGLRVLVLAHTSEPVSADGLPGSLRAVALLTFREQVRPDAAETLAYFREQGVGLRVISGDNPRTVAAVAREVGFEQVGSGYDARSLPDDIDELGDVLEREHVLGRVTPEQKKSIVLALQKRGHVVAMTGDGVNDALALKHADIGIAMGSGAAATRAVSRLVLLDGRFSRLPGVVAEGRRVIANVERVANLFLTKTAQAVTISLVVGILLLQYPFLPRQLSVVSALTIGIPAFFLALMPNRRRYRPGFLRRVLMFSVPAGVTITAAILAVYTVAMSAPRLGLGAGDRLPTARTAATLTILLLSLWVLTVLARPLDRWRALVVGSMLALTALVFLVPFARTFFALSLPGGTMFAVTVVVVAVGGGVIELLYLGLKRRGLVSERE
ncbi:MAG: HAD-IC family P-type ATPase [Microbacterium arborescens]